MVRIELTGMKFFAYHGLYDHEREKGSWFKVDVSFDCDATNAIQHDSIEGTVNYEEVYQIVKEEMGIPSNLIEHVAGRIHNRLQKEVKGVSKLVTKLYKLEAPLGGPLDHVSVTLNS
jgi:7,8-dihydroneopterin aldolase/epimerase/oxygenase